MDSEGNFAPDVCPTASSDISAELSNVGLHSKKIYKKILTIRQLLELVKGSLLDHVAQADASNTARRLGRGNGLTTQTPALLPPNIVSQRVGLNLAEKPQGKDGLIQLVDRILQFSVNTWDHGFMHKLYSGTNPVGVVSELILATLNTNVSIRWNTSK